MPAATLTPLACIRVASPSRSGPCAVYPKAQVGHSGNTFRSRAVRNRPENGKRWYGCVVIGDE
jgi:hypothetical protein